MEKMIKVNFRDIEVMEFPINTTLLEISKSFQKHFNYPILVGKINNDVSNLTVTIDKKCNIDFFDRSSQIGNNVYSSSVQFILVLAVKRVLGTLAAISIENSVDRGVYCEIWNAPIDKEITKKIENEMKTIVKEDLKYTKINVKRLDAIRYFKKEKKFDKVKVLKYISNSYITLYRLDDIYDFFFSEMAYSTKYIDSFKLTYIDKNGIALTYPDVNNPDYTLPYRHRKLVANTFENYLNWEKIIGITRASDLNELVSLGKANEVIKLAEAYYDSQLALTADQIYENKKNIKLILMAGPSSSGKTTTSKKLGIYLKSRGLNVYNISIDDYFIDLKDRKKDANGEIDFESLKAVDLNLFNKHLSKLMNGDKVIPPIYNFKTGKKEYNNEPIKLSENEVIIVEGLHALNDELTSSVPKKNKFKIFISPFTQLNIDDHNRIHTGDTRKLRRIIRDSKQRNHTASETLKMWKKVKEGEDLYIYPFQDGADVIINSSLVYEIGVLKTYGEPLLFSVSEDDEFYSEAIRLINFLRNFLPIPGDGVPRDSVLREFIGGSDFK